MSLRIAFLSKYGAAATRSWSGIPYFASTSLARHGARIEDLGPMPEWPVRLMAARRKLERKIGLNPCLPGRTPGYARACARLALARMQALKQAPDIVFSPAGSVFLAHLEAEIPIVYLSDATFRLMVDYYPDFTGLSPHYREAADAMERAAIRRAALLIYPTHWAAESAIRDYGADERKILIAPLGANFLDEDISSPERGPEDGICRLLFVGVEWPRKGGAIALNVQRLLLERGIAAELTIVGTRPPEPIDLPGVHCIPFLDKSRPEDRERFRELYQTAHFFLLPTRSECFGIVFCEAAAYSLPVVTTRTGGVPEVVRDGENGFTFPSEDDGRMYAARIAEIWADGERYRSLRASSRAAFETRLNWDAWARTVLPVMETLRRPNDIRENLPRAVGA